MVTGFSAGADSHAPHLGAWERSTIREHGADEYGSGNAQVVLAALCAELQ